MIHMPSLAKWTILRSHNITELETSKNLEFWTETFTAIVLNAFRTITRWSLSVMHMLEDLANAISRKMDHVKISQYY